MSKTNKILAGFGVATALGIAISPLAVFADDPTTVDGETTINAIIEEVLSLSLTSSGTTGSYDCSTAANPNCSGTDQRTRATILPSQADLDTMYTIATVNTNSVNGYDLTLTDSDGTTALTTENNDTIATINTTPTGGTNPGWAIAIDKDDQGWSGTWYQVPALGITPLPLKSSHPTPAAVTVNAQTKVTYGVAASSSQPTGIYTDTVVYTATTGV